MFSWGELFVVGAVGITLTGRKDMPRVSRFVGMQVGRIVGLLQGARARADQFAAQHEMRQLQNELRSGLRELDQVRMELAIAASSQGMIGRTLGTTTASANRQQLLSSQQSSSISNSSATTMPYSAPSSNVPPIGTVGSTTVASSSPSATINNMNVLPPVAQTERGLLEDEWEKQGIGFRSRAEQGLWLAGNNNNDNDFGGGVSNNNYGDGSGGIGSTSTGSEILEHIIKQNLMFDQYDRVVREQEQEIQERIENFKDGKRPKDQ